MIYKKTAEKIHSEIKKADKILLVFHVSPDGDSIGSTLALNVFLKKLGKKTKVISFSKIPSEFSYLPGIEKVEMMNFKKVDFSQFDLFLVLDCGGVNMITKSDYPEDKFPKTFKVINIDHHTTNPKFGDINLIIKASSVAEIIYELFAMWQVKIDQSIARLLFLGVFCDTGCFQYPLTTKRSLLIAADLIRKGASLSEVVLFHFRSYSLKTLKYWGKVLDKMQLDESRKFVWSTVTLKDLKELEINSEEEIGGAASLFAPIVKGTEFGIILDENEGFVKGSLRSRQGFDVSKIAEELGGGGHSESSGFVIKGGLEEAEKLVLETVRKAIK